MASGWWDRWNFFRHWWSIYQPDPYWVAPYAPHLRRSLNPNRNSYLSRLKSVPVWLEALPRASGQETVGSFSGIATEKAVAAAVAVIDPRRDDGTAYLAWVHCINDLTSLERLLDAIGEQVAQYGVRKIIGPTGLSPHLGSGLLQDHWNIIPPLHTPYNPPYLPEIAAAALRVRGSGRLFYLPTSVAP